jgi:hypothetical protein
MFCTYEWLDSTRATDPPTDCGLFSKREGDIVLSSRFYF